MYRNMKIYGFTLDAIAQMPVIILKDDTETTSVPIWVNSSEAILMVTELIRQDLSAKSGQKDLFSALLDELEMAISCISIDDLNDGVFSASVVFEGDDGEVSVDVRPSEALVAALKYGLTIRVAEDVIDRASILALQDEDKGKENTERRFVDFLESLDPTEMGKYPM